MKTVTNSIPVSLFVVAVAMLLAAPLHAGDYLLKLDVGGVERVAKVVEPSADAEGGHPLVLAFHGYDDSPRNFSRYVDLHKSWHEALVVYPRGLQMPDAGGTLRAKGWQTSPGMLGDRDLAFTDALLAELGRRYRIDPARMYATGMSNGGRFAFLLMGERAEVFAAFAPVAIAATSEVLSRLVVPRPVLYLIGKGEPGWRLEAAQATVEALSRVNRSTRRERAWAENYILFEPAPGGADFVFHLHEAGHVWPFGASEHIMRFFREHPGAGTGR